MGTQKDYSLKRQHIANNAIDLGTALVDALTGLIQLQAERAKLGQDFQDSDFANSSLQHCDAAMMGAFFDFVITSLNQNYTDSANGERNKQLLLQIRR